MFKSKYVFLLTLILIGVLNMAAPFIGAISGPEQSLAVPVMLGVSVCLGVFAFGYMIVELFEFRKRENASSDSLGDEDDEE